MIFFFIMHFHNFFYSAPFSTVILLCFKVPFEFLVYSWVFSIYSSTDSRKVNLCYAASLEAIYALHCALRDPPVSHHYKSFPDAARH